jgi:hypothetical protein
VAAHLEPGGVVAINVASVRGVSKSLAAMIYRTLRETFAAVTLVNATTSNDVIYATLDEKPATFAASALEATSAGGAGLGRIRTQFRQKIAGEVPGWKSAQILTDDRAPVEMAWDVMTLQYAQ